MTPSHIEHIAIAVTDLDEALQYWENVMGLKCYAIEEVTDQKVKTAFLKCGETKIELLLPTCPESTVAKFIEKNGGRGGMHHIAFAVENTDQALADATLADDLNYKDGHWQGFWGQDIDVEYDFGKKQPIERITMRFLQNSTDWILAPQRIEVYSSKDGKSGN
jgi:methylmalonyl-CoA/ethylmalonyl-CoA epimerase